MFVDDEAEDSGSSGEDSFMATSGDEQFIDDEEYEQGAPPPEGPQPLPEPSSFKWVYEPQKIKLPQTAINLLECNCKNCGDGDEPCKLRSLRYKLKVKTVYSHTECGRVGATMGSALTYKESLLREIFPNYAEVDGASMGVAGLASALNRDGATELYAELLTVLSPEGKKLLRTNVGKEVRLSAHIALTDDQAGLDDENLGKEALRSIIGLVTPTAYAWTGNWVRPLRMALSSRSGLQYIRLIYKAWWAIVAIECYGDDLQPETLAYAIGEDQPYSMLRPILLSCLPRCSQKQSQVCQELLEDLAEVEERAERFDSLCITASGNSRSSSSRVYGDAIADLCIWQPHGTIQHHLFNSILKKSQTVRGGYNPHNAWVSNFHRFYKTVLPASNTGLLGLKDSINGSFTRMKKKADAARKAKDNDAAWRGLKKKDLLTSGCAHWLFKREAWAMAELAKFITESYEGEFVPITCKGDALGFTISTQSMHEGLEERLKAFDIGKHYSFSLSLGSVGKPKTKHERKNELRNELWQNIVEHCAKDGISNPKYIRHVRNVNGMSTFSYYAQTTHRYVYKKEIHLVRQGPTPLREGLTTKEFLDVLVTEMALANGDVTAIKAFRGLLTGDESQLNFEERDMRQLCIRIEGPHIPGFPKINQFAVTLRPFKNGVFSPTAFKRACLLVAHLSPKEAQQDLKTRRNSYFFGYEEDLVDADTGLPPVMNDTSLIHVDFPDEIPIDFGQRDKTGGRSLLEMAGLLAVHSLSNERRSREFKDITRVKAWNPDGTKHMVDGVWQQFTREQQVDIQDHAAAYGAYCEPFGSGFNRLLFVGGKKKSGKSSMQRLIATCGRHGDEGLARMQEPKKNINASFLWGDAVGENGPKDVMKLPDLDKKIELFGENGIPNLLDSIDDGDIVVNRKHMQLLTLTSQNDYATTTETGVKTHRPPKLMATGNHPHLNIQVNGCRPGPEVLRRLFMIYHNHSAPVGFEWVKDLANMNKPDNHPAEAPYYGGITSFLVCLYYWFARNSTDFSGTSTNPSFMEKQLELVISRCNDPKHAWLGRYLKHSPSSIVGYYQHYDVDVDNEVGEALATPVRSIDGKMVCYRADTDQEAVIQATTPIYENDDPVAAGRAIKLSTVAELSLLSVAEITGNLDEYIETDEDMCGAAIVTAEICANEDPETKAVHKFKQGSIFEQRCCEDPRRAIYKIIKNVVYRPE